MNPDIEHTFLEAFETYNDAIFRYCFFETSNREVGRDLAQETFTKAWQYMEQGKEVTHMKAFLYRIAGNLVIDYRRKKKSVSLDSMMEEGYDLEHEEEESLGNAFDGQKLMELLQDVGSTYRDVIIMRFVDDLSIKEIAQITGETENNVSVRIHRGTEKLRTLYEDKMQNPKEL
jgi:RNA polymerase sigma-70 factor (ECF subfamily)